MLLTCLSAPSKKLYDVGKWNACGKSQSLNENEGFYGPGDLGEHLHQALLGPPHLWMTWNTVWMFARVRVQLVLDHRCYHTAAARVRCEKKTVFSFDLCRNNSQTEKTPVAKKKHRICFMAEEATAVKRGHSFFANISAFRKTCWRHSMSGTALQPPPALLRAQLYTNMA